MAGAGGVTCIGWHDPDGCPVYGGDMHGCASPDGHRGRIHTCPCGARRDGVQGRRRNRTARCGTDAGYYRHLDNDEPTCDACKAAHAKAESDRNRRRKLRAIA